MTLTQLRAFVEVAATGSVRQAAARLVVSQPAVSAAVAALQRDLGVALVAREGRGLKLTPAGRVFAGYARQVLGLLAEAEAAAVGGADPTRGRVRIAAVTSAGEHLLPPVLASFRSRHPGAALGLEVGTRERVWGLLADHEADLAIGGRPPSGHGFTTRAVRDNELVVVAAPGVHPEGATWLLREATSGTRASTEAFLEAAGTDPPRLEFGSNGAVIAGAVVGLGMTLVSRDAVTRELEQGQLTVVPLPGTPLQRPWHVVTHDPVPPTTLLLLAHLVESGGFTAKVPPPREDLARPSG
ncbi:MAG: LysR family transcriptional regulator [Egibacteraceae bacterium]